MELLQTLSSSIIRKNPSFANLSEKEKSKIINQTYDKLIISALKQVNVPPKTSLIRQKIIKIQHELRRSDAYREKHKIVDYDLIEKLRTIRNRVTHNTLTSTSISQKSIDTNSAFSKKNFSSSNEFEDVFTNYSDSTNTRSSFFKSIITEDIFKNNTTLKNHIFKIKLNLEQSLKEIYFIEQKNGSSVLEKPQQIKGIHVSKSLFQLYELFTLLDFVNLLEHKFREEGNDDLPTQINNCYTILFEYFKKWLEINGKKINDVTDLENTILSNDEFMNLNPDNPLFEGFCLLMETKIDMKKIKELLDDEELTLLLSKIFKKSC